MTSVTQFAQYLMKLDPQKNTARLCLFHYLKNFCEKDEILSPQVFDAFYRRVLNFQYWQEHATDLGKSVAQDLQSFNQSQPLPFDFREVSHVDQLQVTPLKYQHDLECLVHKHLDLVQGRGDKLKLLPLQDNQFLSIILYSNGSLRARVYSPNAIIIDGELELLSPLTDLSYTAGLELQPGVVQTLEGALLVTSRFVFTDHGCQGVMLRGHALQKYETLSGVGIEQVPELYHALKKLENHYIKAESDPFYQELIGQLEKAYQVVSGAPREMNKKSIETVLQKGKAALKNIFPNDKLLLLLVTNIEYLLINHERRSPPREREPWTNPTIKDPSV